MALAESVGPVPADSLKTNFSAENHFAGKSFWPTVSMMILNISAAVRIVLGGVSSNSRVNRSTSSRLILSRLRACRSSPSCGHVSSSSGDKSSAVVSMCLRHSASGSRSNKSSMPACSSAASGRVIAVSAALI